MASCHKGAELSSLFPFRRIGRWLTRLNQDWIAVYEWNPRLYRRVAASGMVLGFGLATLLALLGLIVSWTVTNG